MSQSLVALRGLPLLAAWLTLGLAMQDAHGAIAQVLEHAAAQQAAYSEAAQTRSELLADLYLAGELGAFLDQLDAFANDSSLNTIARERIVHDAIMLCSQALPQPGIRAYVTTLSDRKPTAYIWLYEGQHKVRMPLFDVGAAARFALRRWDELAASEVAALDLARGTTDYLTLWATDEASRQGILEALNQAETQQLQLQRDAIARALQNDASVDRLALIAATRLADKALFQTLAAFASPSSALRMLADVRTSLAPQDAFEVLRLASTRPAIASAAMLQMGHLASESPSVSSFLLQSLGDRDRGGSAAVALARLQDPAIASELGVILQSTGSLTTRRRAALALKLDNSPAANAELDKFVADPQSSAALKREVATWLAD